uniref:Uncharacterized protein n=1 Tax=Acrobeloides nanus TaxID=290746 RepID=A0A914DIT4_9BILA
MYDMNPF